MLVCAADDAYALPASIAIWSALRRYEGAWPVHVFLLAAGITPRNERRLRSVIGRFPAEFTWIDPPVKDFELLPLRKYLKPATYLRLLIPSLLPDSISKAIYLDCDLLVEADLGELWGIEPGTNLCLATQDVSTPALSVSSLARCPDLRISPADEYFNSGVLVMNLDAFRSERTAERAIEFCRRWPDLIRSADQDALNAVGIGRWGKLDSVWNQRVNAAGFSCRLPGILHFTGHNKPWLPHVVELHRRGVVSSAHRRYDRALAQSGWFSRPERIAFVGRRIISYLRQGVVGKLRKLARRVR